MQKKIFKESSVLLIPGRRESKDNKEILQRPCITDYFKKQNQKLFNIFLYRMIQFLCNISVSKNFTLRKVVCSKKSYPTHLLFQNIWIIILLGHIVSDK